MQKTITALGLKVSYLPRINKLRLDCSISQHQLWHKSVDAVPTDVMYDLIILINNVHKVLVKSHYFTKIQLIPRSVRKIALINLKIWNF